MGTARPRFLAAHAGMDPNSCDGGSVGGGTGDSGTMGGAIGAPGAVCCEEASKDTGVGAQG